MIYRRGFQRRSMPRRFGSFRSRSFPRQRAFQKGPISRVSRAQFWIQSGLLMTAGTAGASTNIAFEMMKIQDHVADFNTASGIVMAGIVSSIDITSIHFDYGIDYDDNSIDFVADAYPFARVYTHTALCVDRLSSNAAIGSSVAPVAMAGVPWFSVQPPISSVTASAPPGTAQEDNWPQRVLWERFNELDYGTNRIDNVPEGALAQTNPRVRYGCRGFFQRKIRTRLSDFEGLYLTHSITPAANGNPARNFRVWFAGALYYKVNF